MMYFFRERTEVMGLALQDWVGHGPEGRWPRAGGGGPRVSAWHTSKTRGLGYYHLALCEGDN